MALELNQADEYVETSRGRAPYFSCKDGQLNRLFSEFRAEGKGVLPLATILERRTHSSAQGWLDSYWGSCTSIVYPAKEAYDENNRRFKVCRISEQLFALDEQSSLTGGALALQSYELLQGKEFLRREVILERGLIREEAKEHPVLLELCFGDRALLDESVERHFFEAQRQFDLNTLFGIYLKEELKSPSERAAFVGLGDWSQFFGGNHLNCGNGRLVGVAPEALDVLTRKYLEYASAFVSHASEVRAGLERYFADTRRNDGRGISGTVQLDAIQDSEERRRAQIGSTLQSSDSLRKQSIAATPPYYSFLDPSAPSIPLDILSEEVQQRAAEAAALEEKERIWREMSWNLNREEGK